VIVDLDALVSAREAEDYPPLRAHGVTRRLIYEWRGDGRLTPRGQRGRSPLYRFGDILEVERDTRLSGLSYRGSRVA
jgi:hypothetical protein